MHRIGCPFGLPREAWRLLSMCTTCLSLLRKSQKSVTSITKSTSRFTFEVQDILSFIMGQLSCFRNRALQNSYLRFSDFFVSGFFFLAYNHVVLICVYGIPIVLLTVQSLISVKLIFMYSWTPMLELFIMS